MLVRWTPVAFGDLRTISQRIEPGAQSSNGDPGVPHDLRRDPVAATPSEQR